MFLSKWLRCSCSFSTTDSENGFVFCLSLTTTMCHLNLYLLFKLMTLCFERRKKRKELWRRRRKWRKKEEERSDFFLNIVIYLLIVMYSVQILSEHPHYYYYYLGLRLNNVCHANAMRCDAMPPHPPLLLFFFGGLLLH